MTAAEIREAQEILARLRGHHEWLRASGACQPSPTARRALQDSENEAARLGVLLGADPVVEGVRLRLIRGGAR